MALNVSRIIQADKIFWGKKRVDLLNMINNYLSDDNILTKNNLYNFIDEVKGSRKHIARKELTSIGNILIYLNEKRLAITPTINIPKKTARPLMLARSGKEHLSLYPITIMMDYLWNIWLKSDRTDDELSFALALTTMVDGAFSPPLFPNSLIYLKRKQVNRKGFIYIHSTPKENSNRFCKLLIPNSSRIILSNIMRNKITISGDEYLICPEIKDINDREKYIKKEWDNLYKSFLSGFKESFSHDYYPDWVTFKKAACQIALHNNILPFVIHLHSKIPQPTSSLKRTPSELRQKNHGRPAIHITIETSSNNEDIKIPLGWKKRSKDILKVLISDIRKITKSNLCQPAYRQKAINAINHARTLANRITNEKSALHLALDWSEHEINTSKRLKAESLEHYLGRVFSPGLLDYDNSSYFSKLSADEYIEFFEENRLREGVGESRENDIISTWKRVFRYAKNHGYIEFLEDFEIEYLTSYFSGNVRFTLLTPHEFDDFFFSLINEKTHEAFTIAVICALSYYGSLRASEVYNLEFRDVVIGGEHVDISIRDGKTDAARRNVFFAHLAPPYIVEKVLEYITVRTEGIKKTEKLLRTNLFGPAHSPLFYQTKKLKKTVNDTLKLFFGKEFVFHDLRHGFASWIFPRYYAILHPDILNDIPCSDHHIFSKKALRKLEYLFTNNPKKRIKIYDQNGLIILAKIIGHKDPETLFTSYIHTYPYIQAHVMKKINDIFGNRVLTGDVILKMIPNTKSSVTRSHLPKPRTINNLVELTWEKAFS